jgi:hypothetical protein
MLYSSWETLNLESETLIISTDHISMMFKPAPETLRKIPIWGKKGAKREDPSASRKSQTQSASQRVLEQSCSRAPTNRKKHIRKRKEWYYLVVSLRGTKPHPSRCNMNYSRSRGRLMALAYYRWNSLYHIGWTCFRGEKIGYWSSGMASSIGRIIWNVLLF